VAARDFCPRRAWTFPWWVLLPSAMRKIVMPPASNATFRHLLARGPLGYSRQTPQITQFLPIPLLAPYLHPSPGL
jgi:hypothetical protein